MKVWGVILATCLAFILIANISGNESEKPFTQIVATLQTIANESGTVTNQFTEWRNQLKNDVENIADNINSTNTTNPLLGIEYVAKVIFLGWTWTWYPLVWTLDIIQKAIAILDIIG